MDGPGARLVQLGQKLLHELPEIRLRALRNLQLKLSTGILSSWLSPSVTEAAQEQIDEFYYHLTQSLSSDDPEFVKEVLQFLNDLVAKGLQGVTKG